tara:strand:- start:328 stop:747 length:420 start_codon:yes stop_codon:yes gene_type:complete
MSGAGIYVVKFVKSKPLVLGLVGPDDVAKDKGGIYDIPKGHIDSGESDWECAKRECLEEAGIWFEKADIQHGPIKHENLTLFICFVEPFVTCKIKQNPKTKEFEHQGYKWLKPEELKNNCYNYLKPIISICNKRLHSLR